MPCSSDKGYESLLLRGLEISRREKGSDHEETIAHLNALVVHFEKTEQADEACMLALERDSVKVEKTR